MNIKSSNHFVLTTFLWGFSCSYRPSPVLSAHPVLRARAYSDWSPLTVPCTRTRTLRFRRSAKSTIAVGSAVALTVPLVPLLFVSSIVLTDARPVHFPICPGTYHGRRHSAAVFPPLVLCTNSCFFDVGSFCAARGNFPSFTPTSSKHWSYRCTARPSPDPLGLRGTIFLCLLRMAILSTAAVAAARCLVPAPSTDANICLQDLFHTPMPPALPHAHSRRRISWNFDTPIAFEAHKLMIA